MLGVKKSSSDESSNVIGGEQSVFSRFIPSERYLQYPLPGSQHRP